MDNILANHTLDYRFGWRWLLPLRKDDRIAFIGFSESELVFWREAIPGEVVTDNAVTATVWVVQDRRLYELLKLNSEHLHTVCVVGSHSVTAIWRKWMVGRFTDVCDYALLPPNNPRIVAPLGAPSLTLQALGVHRPGRWMAQLIIFLLKILIRMGFELPLRSRILCIATKSEGAIPLGARQAGLDLNHKGASQRYALYLGMPGNNRKTVVLPLTCAKATILKCGESRQAQAALRNEAATLKILSRTSLAAQVPGIYDVVERGTQLTLHQEYRARQGLNNAKLERIVVTFLGELSRLDRCNRPLVEALAQADIFTNREALAYELIEYAKVREYLDVLATSGVMIWGHRSHGDFTPWNCAWTDKGFFVFDWEESRAWDAVLCDAFYFVIAPFVHIARLPDPGMVESRALALAEKVVKTAELPVGELQIYWAFWLLRRMSQQPAPLYKLLLQRLGETWR